MLPKQVTCGSKECQRENRKAKKKERYKENKLDILKKQKEYNSRPKVKANRKVYTKEWRNNNQPRIKEYREKNKEKRIVYDKERKQKLEVKERNKITGKAWYQKNKDKVKEYHKEYSQRPDVRIKRQKLRKEYNFRNRYKISQQRKEYKKDYNKNNSEKINDYYKQKRKVDSKFRIMQNLRTLFNITLQKYSTTGKIMSSNKYGINYKKIIEHLKPFPEDLNNYHVDHIIPLSWFDFDNPEEIKWCWSPNNLQWLRKELNIWKSNKFILAIPIEEQDLLMKELNLK